MITKQVITVYEYGRVLELFAFFSHHLGIAFEVNIDQSFIFPRLLADNYTVEVSGKLNIRCYKAAGNEAEGTLQFSDKSMTN